MSDKFFLKNGSQMVSFAASFNFSAVESWLWHPGCGILSAISWLWHPGCRLREASGTRLGGIWEASGSQSRPEEARGSFEPKIDTPPQQNAKVPLKCQFYDAFLRVGVTKYCKLQYKMLAGSSAGATKDSRPE